MRADEFGKETSCAMKIKYPTENQIRARAYQIYLQRGCQPGHETDDWLQAEYDLAQLPIRKFAQFHSFSAWASHLQ